MNITILDTESIGLDLDYTPFEKLGKLTLYPATTPDEVIERLQNTHVVILNKVKLTREILLSAPTLKLICVAATGYDNIDVDTCREKGIALCNVKGYSTESVAQLTLAVVLHLACHLPTYTTYVENGSYTASARPNLLVPTFHELKGKTWGIVGYGGIGQRVCELARAFGCSVLAYKRTPTPEIEITDLATLCEKSDIITLHLPLTKETKVIMSKAMLQRCKPTAIIVNVARGGVIDSKAVAEMILSGRLAGFGSDVYETEPFAQDHPFAEIANLPNVCLTPHVAWAAHESRTRLLSEIQKNISAYIDGDIYNRIV